MTQQSNPDNYLRLRTALNGFQRTPAELNAEEMQAVEQQARKAYAVEQKVLATPEARDVHVPESVVEQALQTIAARYADQNELLADLGRNGLDTGALRSALERELRVEAVIDRVLSDRCEVSEDEAAIFYWQHPDRFTRPEVRTVRHILITVNADYAENTPQEARRRLQVVADSLRLQPKQFENLARQHSECPSALEGGRLGRVKRGMLYPTLEEALFALECGAISEIVESELGLHVLWCEAIEEGGTVPYDTVKEQIIERLGERKRKLLLREWLQGS